MGKRGPKGQRKKSFDPDQALALKATDKGSWYADNRANLESTLAETLAVTPTASTPLSDMTNRHADAETPNVKTHKLFSNLLSDESDSEGTSDEGDYDDAETESDSEGGGYDRGYDAYDHRRVIFDTNLLLASLAHSAVCSMCKEGTLFFEEVRGYGWERSLRWTCDGCGHRFPNCFNSARYGLSRDLVLGMRIIGKGQSGATKFSSFLGLPAPVARGPYAGYVRHLKEVTTKITDEEMRSASAELGREGALTDIPVTIDGSWLTRGFASRQGIVCAMSVETGKIVDSHHLSTECRECEKRAHMDQNTTEYLSRWIDHEMD